MADSSESGITVDAPPSAVMAVIADFDSYPEWAGVKTATVLASAADGRAERVTMSIDAGVIQDEYTLAYEWDGDSGVSWTLVAGKLQKSQVGSYALAPAGDGTAVTYRLAVDITLPMIGLLKRKAERVIMDTALKGLKKRVESLH